MTFQFTAETDENGTRVVRRDPSKDDTQDYQYHFQAGIRLIENSHGAGDVAIYARGKKAFIEL